MESSTPNQEPAIFPAGTRSSHRVLNILFSILFGLTLGYYTDTLLFISIPNNAGLGGLTMALFYFLISVVATVIYCAILLAVQKGVAGDHGGRFIFFTIGTVSIAYSLFAIFIFPQFGQAFTIQLSANSNAELGGELSYQVVPSSGFYTKDITMPVTITKPDGSIIQGYPEVFFAYDLGAPGCGPVFTMLWCIPSTQKKTFYLPPNMSNNFRLIPFQFDEAGTYILASSNDPNQTVTINVGPTKNGLPPVLLDNAVIMNIPGFTTFGPTPQKIQDDGLITFSADYVASDTSSYFVGRSYANDFNKTQTVQGPCNAGDCSLFTYTLAAIGKPMTVDGNKVLVAQAWLLRPTSTIPIPYPANPYYNEVYWISGNSLMNIQYNTPNLPGKNVYDGNIFREYIKQYPSTL